MKRKSVRYLHSAIAVIMAIQFIVAWTMPGVRRISTPGDLLNIHMTFGVIILPFALALFLTRLYRPTTTEQKVLDGTKWSRRAASTMYYLLYILLVLVPLSGWSFASTKGWTVTLFGTYDLPQLFANSTVFGFSVDHMHSALATMLGILIIGHVSAALYHHFFLKDSVLKNMLPWFRKSSE